MSHPTHVFYTQRSQYRPDLIDYLPPSEHKRINQFTSQTRVQLFVLGRALLSQALCLLNGCGNFKLTYLQHGKPLLQSPEDWQFNLTHSGEHLFLALRQHHPIGIDSEIRRQRPYQRLAKKLFSDKAQHTILHAHDPMLAFYYYWTRYEAQIKYLGLSVFSDLPDAPQRFLSTYQCDNLVFSLCSDAPIKAINYYQYSSRNNKHFKTLNNFKPIKIHHSP